MTEKTDMDKNRALMVLQNKKVCYQHIRKSAQILKDRKQMGSDWSSIGSASRAFIDKIQSTTARRLWEHHLSN